jgi:hypothetical protein
MVFSDTTLWTVTACVLAVMGSCGVIRWWRRHNRQRSMAGRQPVTVATVLGRIWRCWATMASSQKSAPGPDASSWPRTAGPEASGLTPPWPTLSRRWLAPALPSVPVTVFPHLTLPATALIGIGPLVDRSTPLLFGLVPPGLALVAILLGAGLDLLRWRRQRQPGQRPVEPLIAGPGPMMPST